MLPRRSRQEMKIIPPSKGGAGGCPVVNVALETRTSPPYAPPTPPLIRGFSEEPSMPRCGTTKDENVYSPLERGGGVGCPEPERPTPEG